MEKNLKNSLSTENFKKLTKSNKKICLDIGCGPSKKDGYVGIDMFDEPNVDYVMDLEHEKIPLPDKSVDLIYTSHFLEHLSDPGRMIMEFNRLLKEGGKVEIIVPHYTNPYAYHFTHKTYWSSFTLHQQYIDYYLNTNLVVLSKKINMRFHPLVDSFFTKIVNFYPNIYERLFAKIIHAWEIEFLLVKDSKRSKNMVNLQLH